jgi:hypothetical protein
MITQPSSTEPSSTDKDLEAEKQLSRGEERNRGAEAS